MTFTVYLKTGESINFSVYNYHYQNIDLKNQFNIDYINIIALYEKTNIEYKLITQVSGLINLS